jgi:DNA-directed RNA polymerase alpha subunit
MTSPRQVETRDQGRWPTGVSRPAIRALEGAGLRSLPDLTAVSEAELLALHGMGPKAVRLLQAALEERGLALRG